MVQSRRISFFRYSSAGIMRLHTYTLLRSFTLGLVSLVSTSTISVVDLVNFSASANAQSFPNDALPATIPSNLGSAQYLVYLPNAADIKRAKIIAPDAFISRLDTGEQVVQLGRFNNLNLAQRRAAQFSQAGLVTQIRTVQGKFSNIPTVPANNSINNSVSTIPSSIPTSNPLPTNSAPIPVESIPIPTSRTDNALPGVPGSEFPSTQNNTQNNIPNNGIEIVRSPQAIPQISQPIPAIANQGAVNTSQLRYFVIIPTGSVSELQRVQAIAPNAQLRSSYRGTYIEVQGYPDRGSAETLSGTVRRQGFDTRVVYF